MNYNIAICDDEVIQRELVERFALEIIEEKNIQTKIFRFPCGEDLLEYYNTNKIKFHIILLDMEMTGINGIAVAKKIREYNDTAIIIFITGYKDYVFNVFEVKTFRYLLKPLKKDKFKKAFNDAIDSINNMISSSTDEVLAIKKNKEDIIVSYKSILYFEKYKNKVLVITDNEDIEFYCTFNELSMILNMNRFIRVHQGFIANIDKIEIITSREVLLKDGKRIPVSRRNAKEVKEAFLSRMRV